MKGTNRVETVAITFAPLTLPLSSYGQSCLLRNTQNVDDELRSDCLDIAGSSRSARVEEPLRVHTCKHDDTNAQYGGTTSEQRFQWRGAGSGQIHNPEFDRCLAATSPELGTPLTRASCENADRHAWSFGPMGRLRRESVPGRHMTIGDRRFPITRLQGFDGAPN